MVFNEKNRELKSETGYLRSKEDGAVYDYAIYLGKYDSAENYEEITETEYNTAKENEKREQEDGKPPYPVQV